MATGDLEIDGVVVKADQHGSSQVILAQVLPILRRDIGLLGVTNTIVPQVLRRTSESRIITHLLAVQSSV